MLVIAGAGTGKTSVLVNRIARLIRDEHARPDEILALTYADNAAGEVRDRVKKELDQDVSKLQAVTFHAYCNGLLHRTGNQFNILDEKTFGYFSGAASASYIFSILSGQPMSDSSSPIFSISSVAARTNSLRRSSISTM